MHKKIFSAALAVLLTFGTGIGTFEGGFIADNSAISASAETEYTSGDFTYTKGYRNNVTITKYTGKSQDVVIPAKIDGYDVTFLDKWMFSDMEKDIVSISLPSTLESIADNFFLKCTNLERIDVDQANIHLGSKDGMLYNKYYKKFLLCPPKSKVEHVVLPEGITEIANQAFNRCDNIKTIEIPDGTTTIGNFAFYVCPAITEISIPKTVETIGNSAFFQCTSLEKYTVDEANEKLSSENGILYNKDKTTLISCPPKNPTKKVHVPASVTTVMSNAFEKCSNITDVFFNGQNTSIPDYTFRGCENLENVEMSDTVKTVGVEAFSGCKNLKNVKISESLESVGNFGFFGCDSLLSVTLPETLTTIDFLAFGFGDDGMYTNFTMIGKPSSETENYAKKYGFTFVDVDSVPAVKDISNCEISLSRTTATYTSKAIKPIVTIMDGSKKLVKDVDYTVSYFDNVRANGTPTITITGKGDYTGTVKKNFTITKKSIGGCDITLNKRTFTFNKKAIKPEVTVSLNGNVLDPKNYSLSYKNNIVAGTATVTITGKGSLQGTTTRTYKIVARSLSQCTVKLSGTSFSYTGSAIKPTVKVIVAGEEINKSNYTVSYKNNTAKGTAKVVITGRNSLKDSVTKTFTIK